MLLGDSRRRACRHSAWPAFLLTAFLLAGCGSAGPTIAPPSPGEPDLSPARQPASTGSSPGPASAGPAQATPSAEAPSAPPTPARAAWLATGSLTTARIYDTATLLLDGRVLVAGGRRSADADDGLASAELYDPASGKWTVTGSMTHRRSQQAATRLQDGRVLVVGGWSGTAALASAELYDPRTGRWTATGSLHTIRSGHTATLLPDGKVLVAGGVDVQRMEVEHLQLAALAAVELYDPATGRWTTTGSMAAARVHHTATLLLDGRVLVAGGNTDGGAIGATAELYDPATGRWTVTGSMSDARMSHAATLLPDGRVLVSGGFVGSDYTSERSCAGPPSACSAELYDPADGRWTATGTMHADRIGHTATLLPDGTVLVVGSGFQADAPTRAELYRPGSGTWTATASPARTRGLTATLLLDGRVLATGGDNENGRVAELYEPGAGT